MEAKEGYETEVDSDVSMQSSQQEDKIPITTGNVDVAAPKPGVPTPPHIALDPSRVCTFVLKRDGQS